MAHEVDLAIRGGLVVDGTGAAPFEADIAISKGRIARIGKFGGSARDDQGRDLGSLREAGA